MLLEWEDVSQASWIEISYLANEQIDD